MVHTFADFTIFPLALITLTIAAAIAVLVFEIKMFISVLRNEYITENVKIAWIIGMVLVHPFVAGAYYVTDYTKRDKS
jgi:hypothetical protein